MSKILVELQEHMGSDRSIANAAWTSSFDKEKREARTNEQVTSIVNRLADEGHSTPFESVILRFWIRHPIFVDRQHMTHRIASHNGLSGRYRTMPTDYFDIPDDVMAILDLASKAPNPCEDPHFHMTEAYYDSCETAVNNYKLSIIQLKSAEKLGLITNEQFKRAREILRGQLPTAGFTERTSIFNLRSFANYRRLRGKSNAQKEIQIVSDIMLKEVKDANICPVAITALERNGWRI